MVPASRGQSMQMFVFLSTLLSHKKLIQGALPRHKKA
jgi:hypothetical protein